MKFVILDRFDPLLAQTEPGGRAIDLAIENFAIEYEKGYACVDYHL